MGRGFPLDERPSDRGVYGTQTRGVPKTVRNPDEISSQASASPEAPLPAGYKVGSVVIDPRRGYIRRPGSDDLYLRNQTFQVLVYLLTHSDRVVGKEELRRAIWGEVSVTDDAFVQCVSDIRRALGDDSREQRIIKTLPRQGYRFVGPVERVETRQPAPLVRAPGLQPEQSVEPATPLAAPVAASRLSAQGWRGAAILGVAALIIAAVVSTLKLGPTSATTAETALTAAPGVRRVVVFYFENQSGTKQYDWLRRGLADMVITGLSRSEQVAVLSRQQLELLLERNGLERDRTPPLDRALELARQSGADSVVVGSFGEIGGAIRFDARIHDVRDGRLLGSESAVSAADQLLSDGDVVALRVASRLGVEMRVGNASGKLPEVSTNSLEAYRLYLLGMEKAEGLDAASAIRLFESALQIDPQFAMASARIGYAYAVAQSLPDQAKPYLRRAFEHPSRLSEKDRLYILVWSALADSDYQQAIAKLNDLVRRYPLEAEAWWRLGVMLNAEGRPEDGRAALQRALVADPMNPQAINTLGMVYQTLGRPDDAIAMHRRYTEITPHVANAFDSLGLSYQNAGRYTEAIEAYKHALTLDTTFEPAAVHLGNAYYQLGRYNDAIASFRRYIAIADYDPDRARGHSSIAWVEWRRNRFAEMDKEIAISRQLALVEPMELFLIDLDRGHPVNGDRLLAFLPNAPNRGRRLTRRVELYAKGAIALHDGRASEALALLSEAVTQPPTTWAIEPLDDAVAVALSRLTRWREAVAEYRRVLAIYPQSGRTQFGLAKALDQSGDAAGAEKEYRRFLELWNEADADAPEVVEAKARLGRLRTDDAKK